MDRKKEIETRFEDIFGLTYSEGLERFGLLVKRAVRFERFAPVGMFDGSKVSMNERDFAIFAFFGCLGAGLIEELGLPALPHHLEEAEDIVFEDSVIDVDFEEVKS